MTRLVIILLLLLFACTEPEQLPDLGNPLPALGNPVKINIDSLADATIEQVNKQKKQKVLLEQDLWRKKRDIKKLKRNLKKACTS